jgi:hypothetical protein
VIPFVYSVIKDNFWRSFKFTWILWSIVWFVFGILMPAWITIVRRTGREADMECFSFLAGVLLGWIPGIAFSCIGTMINWFRKKFFGFRKMRNETNL